MDKNQAFAKTLYQWTKKKSEDLNRLCDHVNLDTVTVEIKGEKIQSDPAVSEVSNCVSGIYREFINDWKAHLDTVKSTPVETGPTVGSTEDLVVGLTRKRYFD